MKAIILAAGKWTRLRPLTFEIPKAMIEVEGKPLLEYNLEYLTPYVDEFIIIVKYKQEAIRDYFWETFKNIPITYFEQGEKKWTGWALFWLEIKWDFFILAADQIFNKKDVERLAESKDYWALAKEVSNPEKYGIFQIDKDNNLINFVEKPEKYIWNLASILFFKLNDSIFEDVKKIEVSNRWEYELIMPIKNFAKNNDFKIFSLKYPFIDITSMQDLENANLNILNLEKPNLGKTIFLEKLWDFEIHLWIPENWAEKIVEYTLDKTDIALRKWTWDWKKRFISIENLTKWYEDTDRFPFTLLNENWIVVWIWWWRPAKLPNISEIENQKIFDLMQENKNNMHTSWVRIYPAARWKWLASKFIKICSKYYEVLFPNFCMSDDIDAENIASIKAFEKLGFQKVWVWKNINNSPDEWKKRFVYIKKY